ncbi:MAG: hypothetical protein FJ144_24570, partial [Deltaproteobacteria bacterium]|nr:hypothetical protein [Deltaproteobacteria bacterium]
GWMAEAPALRPAAFDGKAFLAGTREAPDVSRLPLDDPLARPWRLEPAFPALDFGDPVSAVPSPRGGAILVLEHEGRLWEVRSTDDGGEKRLVLDLSDVVFHRYEAGAEGLALHPDFAIEGAPGGGALFLFYVVERDGALHDRVSRFSWRGAEVDPASEQVLIEQRHDWQEEGEWGEHFGGNLLFGDDGLLFVGFGDEGGRRQDENPQRIDRDLFSGILRIDPDCREGESHPPPRQPETGTTAGYCIPDDNPFVGIPDALEEFWAIGLRNPWGISIDPVDGALWIADVGKSDVEEIDRGVAGGNYQWSDLEGVRPVGWSKRDPERPRLGVPQAPVFTYTHVGGETSIVGGFVYRGAKHGDLVGRYVFGDHGSGRIRSLLATPDASVPVVEEIAAIAPNRLLAFARDQEGEILVLARAPHGIQRVGKASSEPRAQAPLRLSETGLFADVASATPARGVLPYGVRVSAFADGASSRRWVAFPGDGSDESLDPTREHVLFRKDESWNVPAGTVLIETRELPGPSAGEPPVRVETRLLVLPPGGSVYGVNYRWEADGSDAVRIDETLEGVVPGGSRPWWFDGPETCSSCHNAASGYVLGLRARQLAGEFELDGIPERFDQLAAWSAAGLFTVAPWKLIAPDVDDLHVEPLRALDDPSASLEERARSYLDVNCSACHRGAAASFSLEASFPTRALVDRPVRNDHGIAGARLIVPGSPEQSILWRRLVSDEPGIRMPPIGRSTVDGAAAQVVGDWIRSLSGPQSASSESAISRGSPASPL